MDYPVISVIIPTYNSGDFISEALYSVFSQTYNNFEVIVSDDGSRDKTKDIVKAIFLQNRHIKTKLLENIHFGMPARIRNQGILAAVGKWVAFLDSDDLWYKDKLYKIAENINKYPNVDLWCHSEIMKIGNKEIILEHYKKNNPNINQFISLYRGNSLSTSAVTVKRDLLLKVGLFDEDATLAPSEDFDLWLKLAKVAKIKHIKDILGIYVIRKNNGNISLDPAKLFRALSRIAKKHHNEVKNTARFPWIEEIRYKGRVFSATGALYFYQKKFLVGLFFLSIGILYWPFRIEFIKRVFRNFFSV